MTEHRQIKCICLVICTFFSCASVNLWTFSTQAFVVLLANVLSFIHLMQSHFIDGETAQMFQLVLLYLYGKIMQKKVIYVGCLTFF